MDCNLHPRAVLSDSRVHLGAVALAAIALCLELWSVSSAVAARGTELCLSAQPPQGAVGRHCIAERLARDGARTAQLAQYLRGNCQSVAPEAIIASRQAGGALAEAAGRACTQTSEG